jgi:hypothetical protein
MGSCRKEQCDRYDKVLHALPTCNREDVLLLLAPGRDIAVCSASGVALRRCQNPFGADPADCPQTYKDLRGEQRRDLQVHSAGAADRRFHSLSVYPFQLFRGGDRELPGPGVGSPDHPLYQRRLLPDLGDHHPAGHPRRVSGLLGQQDDPAVPRCHGSPAAGHQRRFPIHHLQPRTLRCAGAGHPDRIVHHRYQPIFPGRRDRRPRNRHWIRPAERSGQLRSRIGDILRTSTQGGGPYPGQRFR